MNKLNEEDCGFTDDYEPLVGGVSSSISNGFVGV